jgi:hypothetical protein
MGRTMPEEEFQSLLDDLKVEQPDLESEYVWYETRALGVTSWEVLTIYIAYKAGDALVDATMGKLVDAIIEKGKEWIKRHRKIHDSGHRPFALTVRDQDGNILAAINVDREGNAVDAVQERPTQERPPFDLVPDDIQ